MKNDWRGALQLGKNKTEKEEEKKRNVSAL